MERSVAVVLTRQVRGIARRTFPAAISRRAMTMSRLSDCISGLAPFRSCFARIDAIITSSKRLETLTKLSSTVILAIGNQRKLRDGKSQGLQQILQNCPLVDSQTFRVSIELYSGPKTAGSTIKEVFDGGHRSPRGNHYRSGCGFLSCKVERVQTQVGVVHSGRRSALAFGGFVLLCLKVCVACANFLA